MHKMDSKENPQRGLSKESRSHGSEEEREYGASRCSLSEIAGKYVLYARYKGRWGTKKLNRPLGCAFDELNNYWVIADHGNNRVRILDGEFHEEAFSFCGLSRPGGVAVVERGRTYGILDDSRISIFDLRTLDSCAVSKQLRADHRGLSLTKCGKYLVSLRTARQFWPQILLYDIRTAGEPAVVFEYDMDSLIRGSLPCFIDCAQDQFVISDLGIRAVYTMKYRMDDSKTGEGPKIMPSGWLTPDVKNFVYPAGVCFDADGSVILSDAGASKLYWFDPEYKFKGEIIASDGFCYGSGICLSKKGQLMVCGRKSNEVKFYDLEAAS